MTRREWLAAGASAPLAAKASKNRIGRSRLSVLTDEVATSPEAALDFVRQYKLSCVELRGVPGNKGVSYFRLSNEELGKLAREFKDAGVRVSFLNTGMLKFGLPGGPPVAARKNDTPEAKAKREAAEAKRFAGRFDELNDAIRAAHALDVAVVRVFAFTRVAEPMALLPRVAEIIGEMAERAAKEGVKLLVENEASCNVASSAECAAMMKLLPSKRVGLNWDPHNSIRFEQPFPDGYALLPPKRIGNVQVKGRSIIPGMDGVLDWGGIFRALEKDGYSGHIGLETHIFDRLVESAHESIREMLKLVEAS